ncbi:MAG: hypothetical protein CMF48_07100 [Legionellales bacterium]|nr:hypothetical protein [Legionellales bacterium]
MISQQFLNLIQARKPLLLPVVATFYDTRQRHLLRAAYLAILAQDNPLFPYDVLPHQQQLNKLLETDAMLTCQINALQLEIEWLNTLDTNPSVQGNAQDLAKEFKTLVTICQSIQTPYAAQITQLKDRLAQKKQMPLKHLRRSEELFDAARKHFSALEQNRALEHRERLLNIATDLKHYTPQSIAAKNIESERKSEQTDLKKSPTTLVRRK